MNKEEQDEAVVYKVVINEEGQYSIWLAERENPYGWTEVGKVGTKKECIAFIDEVWTDMRPISLRRAMEGKA